LDEFRALELWIYNDEDYGNIAKHIDEEGLYQIDKFGDAIAVFSEEHKAKAKAVLIAHREDRVNGEFDNLSDEEELRLREYWDRRPADNYGLLSPPADDWRPNKKHAGYQMLQALLIKSRLLTKEQMKDLKDNPKKHLPEDLIKELNLAGVGATPKAIRRHVINAAATFDG